MRKISYYSIVLIILFYQNIIFAEQKFHIEKTKSNYLLVESKDSVVQNRMWEHTLISKSNYTNPYKDVIISVHYSNSDSSITYDSHGFWDGDSIFKIRSYFPTVGQWNWKTTSSNISDLGLHNKSGSIEVTKYEGKNKIYKHGEVKISNNNKYLTYRDDTPFLWIGGSGWALPMSATYNEWKTYIDDRHSKKFNVVQIAPARAHGGIWVDPPIIYPTNWKGDVCFFSDDKWNPPYWQEFDRFIDYANSKDMIVVVVGLAEPVYDELSIEDAKLFARNFSARVEGYHVILSPAFDVWNTYQYDVMDSTGVSLNNSRHLISQHTGHSYGGGSVNEYSLYFRDKNYLDFSMNQTGHNGGDTEVVYRKAREWNINLLNEPPLKPVINTEALFSAGPYATQITINSRKGTDENARELGWLSLLSGSLGYSYGAQGIWNYGEPADENINLTIPFDSALAFVSSTQMKYIVDFFNSFSWWKLEPNHSAIIYDGWVAEEKKMALSVSDDGKFGVAFLPDANSIKIDMNIFSNTVNATWYDPLTGVFTDGEQNVTNNGQHTFIPPNTGEWALLLDNSVTLSVKIFLAGAYSTNKMTTNLASVIPYQQPYDKLPWNYNGNETIDTSFIIQNKIVDWVLIELRTGSSPSSATTVVQRKAVPINEDGYIVDLLNGTTNVKFSVNEGDYYVVIYHRNHLGVMSSQTVNLSN